MISSRFNYHLSIWALGRDIWLAGTTADGDQPLVEILRLPDEAPVVGIQYVREGLVHVVLANRVVYRFGATVDISGPVFDKIGHLP